MRFVPANLGLVVCTVAVFMVSPILGALSLVPVILMAGVFLRAFRAGRSERPDPPSLKEELTAAWDFRAREALWRWAKPPFFAYIIVIFISIEGYSTPVSLFAVGAGLMTIQEIAIDPWMLARDARRHGLSPEEVGADKATLRKALARKTAPWSPGKRVVAFAGAVAVVGVMVWSAASLRSDRDVPDLRTLDASQAARELENHDLEVETVGSTSGFVCDQKPGPGDGQAKKGETVTIYLCPR